MSKFLIQRVRAIERIHAVRPPDPATLCPVAWTARFEAHSPENAAIMARARQYPTTVRGEHVGHVVMGLLLEAGYDAWDGETVTMPPLPTAEQLAADQLSSEFLGAIADYQRATGDRFPLAVYRLG